MTTSLDYVSSSSYNYTYCPDIVFFRGYEKNSQTNGIHNESVYIVKNPFCRFYNGVLVFLKLCLYDEHGVFI